MSDGILDQAERTPALLQKVRLEEPARALARPEQTPRQYLDALLAGGHLVDAIRWLAWALGRREAVWWACQCLHQVMTEQDASGEQAALEAAEKWAAGPSEARARAARPAAESADYGTPAGCAAMAAHWSGGGMPPQPEHLLPTSVANAVILAAVRKEPEKAEEKYRRFLALGLEVAEGKNRWQDQTPARPRAAPVSPPHGR